MSSPTRQPHTLARVVTYLGIVATVAAAAASPFSPEEGRTELLWSPLWLGLPLVLVGFVHGTIARFCGSVLVSLVSALALLLPVGISCLRLAHAFFTPAAERDVNTWHLWPLFTLLHLGYASVLSLAIALALWGAVRAFGARAA